MTTARDTELAPPGFVEPTFGQRLLARAIDVLVVLPVALLLGAVTEGGVRRALTLAIVAAYEVTLVVRRGQTVGKIAMGTRIVEIRSGLLPSPQHAAARWLAVSAGSIVALAIPAIVPLDAIYMTLLLVLIMRPPLHRGLHDLAARTIVTSVR